MVERDLRLGFGALGEGIVRPDQLLEALAECLRQRDLTISAVLEGWGLATSEQLGTLKDRLDWPSDHDQTARATPEVNGEWASGPRLVDADAPTASPLEPPTEPWTRPAGRSPSGDPPTAGGRYRLIHVLGHGGLGRVWLALDLNLGREVALKELRGDRRGDLGLAHRLVEEAKITSRLEHPGIVPLYDVVETEEDGEAHAPFYTMRRLAGRTLAGAVEEYHRRNGSGAAGPLEFRGLLDTFTAVCQAVAFAHSRDVLHRDLKGSNVVLGDFGEVFVIDWGLAKFAKSGSNPSPSSLIGPDDPERDETEPGSTIGTPGYIAPELVEGEHADRRSDVYSLGAILYLILTGRAAYVGPAREVLRALAEREPEPPRTLAQDVPAPLEAICLKAMSRHPSRRYDSAAELAEEIRRWLADEPVGAYPDPLSKRLARLARKHRTAVLALSAGLVTALVVQSVAFVKLWEQERRTEEQRILAVRQAGRAENGLNVTRHLTTRLLGIANDQLTPIPGTEPARATIFESARLTFHRLLEENPRDPFSRFWTAHVDRFAANLHRSRHRTQAAGPLYRESIALFEGLANETPGDPLNGSNLSLALADHAAWLASLGRLREAAASFGRAVEVAESMISASPGRPEPIRSLAKALADWAMIERVMGDPAESVRLAGRAVENYRALLARDDARDTLHEQLMLGWSYLTLAGANREFGHLPEAREAADRGLEVARALIRDRREYGDTRDIAARLLVERAASGDVGGDLDEALTLASQLVKESPQDPSYRAVEAEARRAWAAWKGAEGAPAEALDRSAEELDASRTALESLAGRFEDVPEYRVTLAGTLVEEGRLAARRGRAPEAVKRFEWAVGLLEGIVARVPEDDRDRKTLDQARKELARARAPEAGRATPSP